MHAEALDFLRRSPLWDVEVGAKSLTVPDLQEQLRLYRSLVLTRPIGVATGCGGAVGAREAPIGFNASLKLCALYFDDVLLPDPIFALSETVNTQFLPPDWVPEDPREQVARAMREVKMWMPLVGIGRVRFVPSSVAHEGPEELPLIASEDAFASRVPSNLRQWFYDRVVVRKVVTDGEGRRLVLRGPTDAQTESIQVEFGQQGRVAGYDHWRIVGANEEDRSVQMIRSPPADDARMQYWLLESTHTAAHGLLTEIVSDFQEAHRLRCSLVTMCPVTSDLLDRVDAPGVAYNKEANAALQLSLPSIEDATPAQLAKLIDREHAALEGLRGDLRDAGKALAGLQDFSERQEEAKNWSRELAVNRVQAVDSKVREARQALKWDIPITVAHLAAGAFGLVAKDPGLALLAAALLTGTAQAASALKRQFEHRGMPGYFLWRLNQERD